jgi:Sortase domain
MHSTASHRGRVITIAVAALLVLGGATTVTVALTHQHHAPQPPAAAERSTGGPAVAAPSTTASDTNASATSGNHPAAPIQSPAIGPILPAATPVMLDIPSIGVNTSLMQLGLNADHTVQVPPLGAHSQAGWYRNSPAPGQLGPAVILGHVDSAKYGAAVFFKLGALRPGDTVIVTRSDHVGAVFRVDRVVSFPKDQFPTLQVYGNTRNAALRLITCGGKFDSATRNYENNIVVFASLVSSHRV